MHTRNRPAIVVLLLAATAACWTSRMPGRSGAAPALVVEVHVTSGDRTRLLARQPDVPLRLGRADAELVIEVDTGQRFQEMVGFGASLTDASAWLIQHRLTPAARERLLQELFGRGAHPDAPGGAGLGFSFVRVDMGASDFALRHYSYDDVPPGETDPLLARFSIEADRAETLPILRRARAINPGLVVMASPWSAPGWMKTTGSLITGTLRPEFYDAYAEYFRRFIAAYAAEGVPVWAITVVNEPHYEPENYPGMRFEPPQRATFIGRHLGPLLERSGIATRILDWDHNWDQPESPLQVLGDAAARRYVAGVAWHCYGGDVAAQSVVRDAHPDKDVFFTECSGGAWAPKFNDNLVWTVRHLIIGATRHWARGVLMWNLALDEKHGPHRGGCGDCRGVVTIDSATGAVTRNEEYFAFGHASRFVRPGARRVASSPGRDGMESVAFRNPHDGTTVLIVLNATPGDRAVGVQAAGHWFRYALPPESVVTFRWP